MLKDDISIYINLEETRIEILVFNVYTTKLNPIYISTDYFNSIEELMELHNITSREVMIGKIIKSDLMTIKEIIDYKKLRKLTPEEEQYIKDVLAAYYKHCK